MTLKYHYQMHLCLVLPCPPVVFKHQKAKQQGLTNIQFHHAGFLTYEHLGEPLHAVVSQYTLHHLPDFWKLIARTAISITFLI